MGDSAVTNVLIECTTLYSLGGTVTGLAGTGLVLQNDGGDDLAIAGDGPFFFTPPLAPDTPYSVSVATQPSSPSQRCTVANGTGTMGYNTISNVSVTCITVYSIGGILSGVSMDGLVLASPGQPDLPVDVGATSFTFASRVPEGTRCAFRPS